jgi:hypothetical protein
MVAQGFENHGDILEVPIPCHEKTRTLLIQTSKKLRVHESHKHIDLTEWHHQPLIQPILSSQ